MKKILFILVAFLGIIGNVCAKDYATCVIKDGNGASVAVTVVDYGGETVVVTLSSDCDHPVLVSFNFNFKYPCGKYSTCTQTSRTITEVVQPNQSASKTYNLGHEIDSIEDVIIDGARCEK